MGLAVGMTKGQVYELSGIANYVEGYDWGSVWFYKIRKGGNEGTLANKDIEQRYMPVVFDNTDRVMGYGRKFYDQTLSDLGTGQFRSHLNFLISPIVRLTNNHFWLHFYPFPQIDEDYTRQTRNCYSMTGRSSTPTVKSLGV